MDKVELLELVEKINRLISEGMTYTEAMKSCEIAKTTLYTNLEAHGFKYDKAQKKIVEVDGNEDAVMVPKEFLEKFEEMYSWYLVQKDEPKPLRIDLQQFEGEILYKTMKIYSNVERELNSFCRQHREHLMQDIVNAAILEFISKNK